MSHKRHHCECEECEMARDSGGFVSYGALGVCIAAVGILLWEAWKWCAAWGAS